MFSYCFIQCIQIENAKYIILVISSVFYIKILFKRRDVNEKQFKDKHAYFVV